MGDAIGGKRSKKIIPEDRDMTLEVTPKRIRYRPETDNGSDDPETMKYARDRHNHQLQAQQMSEGIIELLHVCTLIQVALNKTSKTNTTNKTTETRQEASGSLKPRQRD